MKVQWKWEKMCVKMLVVGVVVVGVGGPGGGREGIHEEKGEKSM